MEQLSSVCQYSCDSAGVAYEYSLEKLETTQSNLKPWWKWLKCVGLTTLNITYEAMMELSPTKSSNQR